jgi:3-methyladenine DNA glycosylase AlkD
MTSAQVLKELKFLSNAKAIKGMARFGINIDKAFGVSMPNVRALAKEIGKDHELAQELWKSGIHEARILAGLIDEPDKVLEKQMDRWVKDFNSWDVCDQVCFNLFDKTEFVFQKINEWSKREEEFVKRTGFALMASLAIHNKKISDKEFENFFPIIIREARDERNFVRKAVNWALRQIGKRNINLNKKAIKIAEQIQKIDSKSAKWIANDAIRELSSQQIQNRLKSKIGNSK